MVVTNSGDGVCHHRTTLNNVSRGIEQLWRRLNLETVYRDVFDRDWPGKWTRLWLDQFGGGG